MKTIQHDEIIDSDLNNLEIREIIASNAGCKKKLVFVVFLFCGVYQQTVNFEVWKNGKVEHTTRDIDTAKAIYNAL